MLKGSTAAVLEQSFPKLVHRDATTMPDTLLLSLPMDWIADAQYTKALRIATNRAKYVLAKDESTFYVLTTQGRRSHSKITPALVKRCAAVSNVSSPCDIRIRDVSTSFPIRIIPKGDSRISSYRIVSHCIRYESILAGVKPTGIKKGIKGFEQLADLCASVVKLTVATDVSSICPCEANPCNLFCPCKGARKIGICNHILAVTHCIMAALPPSEQNPKCNLKYLTSSINKNKKKLKRSGIKPGHCLSRDSEDSDDEPLGGGGGMLQYD